MVSKAAKQGHADAQNNLGNCYHLGTGVEINALLLQGLIFD